MSTDVDRSPAIAAGVVVASPIPEALPGLGDFDAAKATNLEVAVVATLDEYRAAGLVTAASAGKVALATELAAIIADKRRRGRTSTVANDARLLTEILDGFVAEEGAGSEALRAAMAEWSARVEAYAAGVAAGQASALAS